MLLVFYMDWHNTFIDGILLIITCIISHEAIYMLTDNSDSPKDSYFEIPKVQNFLESKSPDYENFRNQATKERILKFDLE